MNNEVLRRKLFRTVLADSRAPAGILASSPEMVDTVSRRANGGTQAGSYELNLIPELVQRGDVRALQALTAPSYPKQVRLAASKALGSVTTKEAGSPTADFLSTSGQQLARGAGNLGQGILDAADATNRGVADFVTTAARNDAERLSSLAKSVGDSDVAGGFMQGVGNIGEALRKTFTPSGAAEAQAEREALREPSPTDSRFERLVKSSPTLPSIMELAGDASEGILSAGRYLFTDKPYDTSKDDVSTDPRVRSPFTPGPIAEGNTEEEQLDDEYTSITPFTPGEELSASSVSGADTQSTTGSGRKISTVPPTAADIANQVDQALSGNRDQSPESRALETARQDFEAGADEAILGLETKLTDLNAAMLSGNIDATERLFKAEGDVKAATDAYNKALEKGFVEAKEFTLKDVKDEALKLSGIKKENYDEDRKNAFWFNLIRAGLATAAGESENTLTNLAKGLGFGVEGYGKDIGTINSQEREDRKELRNLQLQLINNKNSRELALTAAENDFNYNQQRLAQAQKEGADTRLLQAQSQADTTKLALQRLDVETAFQISSLTTQKEKALLDFDQQIAQMDQKDRQLAEQRAFDQWKANLATVSDEFWDVVGMGANYAVKDDDGNWNLTGEGEKYYKRLISASLTSGLKITDLQRNVSNVAQGVSIQGVPLGKDAASRLGAASIWVSGYRKEFEEAEQYQKRSILERYIKDASPYLDPDMPLNILDTLFEPQN